MRFELACVRLGEQCFNTVVEKKKMLEDDSVEWNVSLDIFLSTSTLLYIFGFHSSGFHRLNSKVVGRALVRRLIYCYELTLNTSTVLYEILRLKFNLTVAPLGN